MADKKEDFVGAEIFSMNEILNRMDKIIDLLGKQVVFREAIDERFQQAFEFELDLGGNLIDASNNSVGLCNCGNYRTGELTGGWYCPVHGQRF